MLVLEHHPIGELDELIPVMGMITTIHIMLVAIGKFCRDDASDKNHENEGVIGWMLLVLLLVESPYGPGHIRY